MQNAQLMSHVDTDLVTREQLALVETPDATRSFKPVPHIELIATLEDVLRENHIAIRKEQFALRQDGSTLFAVLQLGYTDTPDGAADSFRFRVDLVVSKGMKQTTLCSDERPRTAPCRRLFANGFPLFGVRDYSRNLRESRNDWDTVFL